MTIEHSKGPKRPLWLKITILAAIAAIVGIFILLGNWQVKRLAWKTTLIETVKARTNAPAIAPPGQDADIAENAYRLVNVTGKFDHSQTIYVKALTELGMGYWVMTPLKHSNQTIWINRGFIPTKLKISGGWQKTSAKQSILGLLRETEPRGTWLEKNNPAQNLWVSRDINAMSEEKGIKNPAPYFLDQVDRSSTHNEQKASASQSRWPLAGMTKLNFRNPHLVYALTWYAMAILLAGGTIFVVRRA